MTDKETLEALGHALFKGKAVNCEAWKLDDKSWIKDRAMSWKNIKKRLFVDFMGLSRSQRKDLENYYLRGKVPKFNPEKLISINFLYLCWLHPDHSEENWQLIKDVIWLIGGEIVMEHYRQSIGLLIGGGYSADAGFPDGLLGGLEERMFNLLVDEDVANPYVKFNCDERLTKFADGESLPYYLAFEFSTSAMFITYDDKYTARYKVWQYDRPLEYWYASLTDKMIETVYKDKRNVNKLLRFLAAVAECDVTKDPSHYKSIYVKKVRKILCERALPEKLNELWEEAKEKANG